MIVIKDGILNIPESERFVGFKGDNNHTQKNFFIRSNPESGWLYRLYLTFDDGRHNFFTLPATFGEEGTLLEWNIQEDHILKSGLVRAQIKAFSEDNEVYHTTSDVFVAGKTAEEDDEFKNSNSEFLAYEKILNDLYKKMMNASSKMPYVGENGNWMVYDENSEAYKDSGISSAQGVGDKSITPEKLDRSYWEKKISLTNPIAKAEDLYNAIGFLNYGGSIAFLNVDMKVNIGESEVEFADIKGYCYAVGIRFENGDTVYLYNVTDGTSWKINRFNEGTELVPLYRLQCIRHSISDGSVTPEKLDRKYLERCVTEYGETITTFAELYEKVGRINRGGKVGFVRVMVSDNANDTINKYSNISGDFMAVGSLYNVDIYLVDLRNGDSWTVSKNDDGKYYAYKVDALTPRVEYLEKNANLIFTGGFSDIAELKQYSFSKGMLYHFYLGEALAKDTGVEYGYCLGTYGYEEGPGGYLSFINFETFKTGILWLKTGAFVENTTTSGADGYTPVKGVDYFTEEDKAGIVKDVIESLGGNPVFGYVDEDNNIVVSGNLAEGSYSVKYEMEDGTAIDIGNLVLGEEDSEEPEEPAEYTNFCVPDGDGWIDGGRCSSTGEDRTDNQGYYLTNYIAVKNGDVVYVKNFDITTTTPVNQYCGMYDAEKTPIKGFIMTDSEATGYCKDIDLSGEVEQFTIDNANAGYVRIVGGLPSGKTKADIVINIKRDGQWL